MLIHMLALNKAREVKPEVTFVVQVLQNMPLVSEDGASALFVYSAGVDTWHKAQIDASWIFLQNMNVTLQTSCHVESYSISMHI